jgi:hypothetical protein
MAILAALGARSRRKVPKTRLCRLTSTETLNLRDTLLPLLGVPPKTRHATQGQKQKIRHAKAEINQ